MSDDELDRHLRAVLASVIPPSASISETADKYLAARAGLRLAIDAAVRAEREACAKLADIEHEDPGDDIDSVLTRLAAAIRNRSNT